MGLRYRKSIKLGGGFRVNISKSGVGYSWGTKGYRVTKTATGQTRKTYSIPGTGLSYVKTKGKKRAKKPKRSSPRAASTPVKPTPSSTVQFDWTETVSNEHVSSMTAAGMEEILAIANKNLRFFHLCIVAFIISFFACFVVPFFFFAMVALLFAFIYLAIKGYVSLDYDIDPEVLDIWSDCDKTVSRMMQSQAIWAITENSHVINGKYVGGASQSVRRFPCKKLKKPPFPFRIKNLSVPCLQFQNQTLLFLPDKLLIMKGRHIGALDYTSVTYKISAVDFQEPLHIPRDAHVVGNTWQYVNKSGGPDRRFSNNRQIPLCRYGQLELTSPNGLHTLFLFSNPSLLEKTDE